MTAKKWLGCLMGLAGVVLVNLGGSLGEQPFALLGEGMLLLSVCFVSAGAICSKVLTQGRDPFLITGWQLTLGGGVLLGAGLLLGGAIGAPSLSGMGLMAWLVAISAVGFTIWTFLLKYNPVGQIAVFSFLTPVFGALLSSLVLGESLLSPATVLALALVAGGIIVVNR